MVQTMMQVRSLSVLTLFLFCLVKRISAHEVSRNMQGGSVSNDLCVNAQPFPLGSSVVVNLTLATVDATEVPSNCFDLNKPSLRGVWYSFNGTGGLVAARACTSFDPAYVSIYRGSCGAANLQCVAGTFFACGQERFFFNTTQGTTYYVLLQSSSVDNLVDFSIFVPPPIENDVCANAKPFVLGSTVSVDPTYAGSDALEVPSRCFVTPKPYYPGVWYSVVGTGGTLVARSCSVNYTSISIYQGNCGAANLQCVAGTERTCERERFFFNTTLGTTYYVLFQSYSDAVADLSIFVPPPVENDACANAQPIALGSTVSANHTYATSDELDVLDNCSGLVLPVNPGVWYSFNGTGRNVFMDTCNSTAFVVVSVYVGNCGSSLQCVAFGYDVQCGLVLSIPTESDTRYLVLVQAQTDGRSVLSFYEPAAPCGIFERSIFCPLTFQGIFGRLIRRIIGGL